MAWVLLAGIVAVTVIPTLVSAQGPVRRLEWLDGIIAEPSLNPDSTYAASLFQLDPVGLALYRQEGRSLPILVALTRDPARSPDVASWLGREIVGHHASARTILRRAASYNGTSLPSDAALPALDHLWTQAGEPGALFNAIAAFYDGGRRLSGNSRDELRRLAPRVSPPVARIAAFLLMARTACQPAVDQVFDTARLPKDRLDRNNFDRRAMEWVESLAINEPRDDESTLGVWAGNVDFERLYRSADYLGGAVDMAVRGLDDLEPASSGFADDTGISFSWDTPAGRVAIGGPGTQQYVGPHLLILDLGGDDEYRGSGAAVFPRHPVCLLIDRAGNDRYAPPDSSSAGVGGAVGGISIVADLSGDDSWRSWQVGLGSSFFGAALLWDRAGNDRYESSRFGQGAAAFGIGILLDEAGRDEYAIHDFGQGLGAPAGVGWLIDAEGDDTYQAVESPGGGPLVEHMAVSSGQGYGFGAIGPMSGSPSALGGFGLLLDTNGNDNYRCRAEGQGGGQQYGVGLLIDTHGSDVYEAKAASQGCGNEHGYGLLLDTEGDDTHHAGGMSLGSGHGFGIGCLVDGSGQDRYSLSDEGLGSADDGGLGMFIDLQGDDEYRQGRMTTQCFPLPSAQLRDKLWTTGLFFDGSGTDVYLTLFPEMTNTRSWGANQEHQTIGQRPTHNVRLGIDR